MGQSPRRFSRFGLYAEIQDPVTPVGGVSLILEGYLFLFSKSEGNVPFKIINHYSKILYMIFNHLSIALIK